MLHLVEGKAVSREIFTPVKKIAPSKGGTIFSCTPTMKNSPPGYLFTITVCEKIAAPLFGREKFAPTTAIFLTGRFFHVVDKALLS